MWKKETTHKNALYINICAARGSPNRLNEIYKNVRSEVIEHKEMKVLYCKSDKTAVDKRKFGNLEFQNRDWFGAMELFNESLCFAENGSATLGYAYANRSACFFNLKMYDKCLIDIDLAMHNNYPKHSFAELQKRQKKCEQFIENGWKASSTALPVKLGENVKFPSCSDAIDVKTRFGRRSVVANRDVSVGQIIAVDEAFTKTLFTIYGWKCNICLKGNTNLVPCKKCTTAMFCPECFDNPLHKYECGLKTSIYSQFNNYLMQELRTFFVAMNLFESADQMMTFVEKSLAGPMPDSCTDERTRYIVYLKSMNIACINDQQFAPIVFCMYKMLLEIPTVRHSTLYIKQFYEHFYIFCFVKSVGTKYVCNEKASSLLDAFGWASHSSQSSANVYRSKGTNR